MGAERPNGHKIGWAASITSPLPCHTVRPIERLGKMSRAKRWVFTLNNWSSDEQDALEAAAPATNYIVWGREVGENNTPHLQGYVEFPAAIRFTTVKNRLGSARFHLEVARGSATQNRAYCTKDGDYTEHGDPPTVGQGQRTDLDRFYDWSDAFFVGHGRGPTTPEVAGEFPAILTRYPRVMEVLRLRTQRQLFIENPQPREWQQRLRLELESDADDRKIHFVVDPDGGCGKSWFVRWFLDLHPDDTQMLSTGRVADVAYAVRARTRVFLIDIPRGGLEFLQTQVLEAMKNRLIFSPKYASGTKTLFQTPQIAVFTNEHPVDVNMQLTVDRYNYIDIN